MKDFSYHYNSLDETPVSRLTASMGGMVLSHISVNAQKYVFINDYVSIGDRRYIKLVFISSGSGRIVIGGAERQIKQGMVAILDGDNGFNVFPGSPVILYICAFLPELFGGKTVSSASLEDLKDDPALAFFFENSGFDRYWIRIPKIKLDAIQHLFNDMVSETEAPTPAYRQLMRLKISELLIRLSESTLAAGETPELRDVQMVNQVIGYIKNNYAKKLTYDDLAKMICVSRSKLFSVFKEVTGKTIGKYIELVRIERACILLTTTNDTVYKIMLDVGYRDMKMFCKRFKEFNQVTPTDYRKQHIPRV